MLYRLLDYLKFYITATNQHSIHSPFVYNYITKCIYKKSYLNYSKAHQVLLKSIAYFDSKNIKIADQTTYHVLLQNTTNLNLDTYPIDLIYEERLNSNELLSCIEDPNMMHNDALLFIPNIHTDKKKRDLWKTLKNHTRITVSIDFYVIGVLFIRKEQVKEHFKIRI